MATRSAKIDQKADLIWAIADKLTGVYKPHEYGDVILPLTVIRRFDCILSDTKDAVLQKYDEVKNLPMKDILLRKASKKDFYNTSKYTFERLMDDPDHIEENFREYLNKFSANVRDILEKFKFDGHITTMANKGILYIVLKEYTTDRGNLHPNEISNLEMGYIFEEIIRRFSESHNEDAGQHYTPREVIQLMVNILFYDDNDILSGNNVAKTIYDPACGTGGMLSVAEEYLHSLNASTELVSFGQEINDQTFAICKADMLIKGNNADYIKDGNTLSDDQFAGSTFDYILSNPPFGREWKNEKAKVEEEAKLGFGGRFGAGLPAASDGQMLFLMTAISKMKDIDKGGSRIAIIHNGSPLFTGDAGSGPSEIRRYILENDLLEAIIALPNDIFYNTGIATYIWVLSNKKAGTVREGKVQLINANEMFVKRRKALGNKRNDISKEDIAEITKIYGDFKESEISQIYDDEDFGYTKITVERPLRDEEGNLVLKKGKKQPDTSLRDTENVPLKEDIKEYFEREVLPFAPDAWVDEKKSKVGYEIPFTRYFYKGHGGEKINIDDKVLLEYYKLEKDFEGPIELESTEGGYTPISGDSGHREPKKDPLTVIIDKINEKYGTHFTEMDKVLVQMENDYANQEKWQSYAKNNDRATFMLLFEKDFPNMAADRYEQNDQFFRKLFDDPDMMRQVMETVGSVLYERLKKKYIFDPKSGVIEEATPETYVEDTYLTKK